MRVGFIALIGRPNAGKSTLLNALLKHKVAIISPKAQTTRNQIRGIYNDQDSQLIFVDTPGIHKAAQQLGRVMNTEANHALQDADVAFLLTDATQAFGKGDEFVLGLLEQAHKPTFLVLNKIDLISKEQLIQTLLTWQDKYPFQEIVPISARKENNLEELLNTVKTYLPEEEHAYYPTDQYCDYSRQFQMTEIIREKILQLTHEEVPHSVAILIEKMGRKKGILYVSALILVDHDSQKGIIIGKQGSMLKTIGTEAREEIEKEWGERVYLELFVRVEKNWRNRENQLRQLGYLPEKEDFDE